ncbi:hypothetical protein [Massilia pseudoviolaceinigra]|uniref:hypothetical protein n=1 Tax=Massilia pseudoviolaceinigra TaxID=3057165 RepID=UPI002796B925|nr:hypothetical protein [Massilia sp. CCM 9206]MDQ1920503.1 hypothetical protein [Massilia sp. CCM 9206]
MKNHLFKPGFRMSFTDVIVIILGICGSVVGMRMDAGSGLPVALVVGHFFAFCNVFRLPRKLELIWATFFLIAAGTTIVWQWPGWYPASALSIICAVVLVGIHMRQPSYHGVGWKYLNPHLPAWWEARRRDTSEPGEAANSI